MDYKTGDIFYTKEDMYLEEQGGRIIDPPILLHKIDTPYKMMQDGDLLSEDTSDPEHSVSQDFIDEYFLTAEDYFKERRDQKIKSIL